MSLSGHCPNLNFDQYEFRNRKEDTPRRQLHKMMELKQFLTKLKLIDVTSFPLPH